MSTKRQVRGPASFQLLPRSAQVWLSPNALPPAEAGWMNASGGLRVLRMQESGRLTSQTERGCRKHWANATLRFWRHSGGTDRKEGGIRGPCLETIWSVLGPVHDVSQAWGPQRPLLSLRCPNPQRPREHADTRGPHRAPGRAGPQDSRSPGPAWVRPQPVAPSRTAHAPPLTCLAPALHLRSPIPTSTVPLLI